MLNGLLCQGLPFTAWSSGCSTTPEVLIKTQVRGSACVLDLEARAACAQMWEKLTIFLIPEVSVAMPGQL